MPDFPDLPTGMTAEEIAGRRASIRAARFELDNRERWRPDDYRTSARLGRELHILAHWARQLEGKTDA